MTRNIEVRAAAEAAEVATALTLALLHFPLGATALKRRQAQGVTGPATANAPPPLTRRLPLLPSPLPLPLPLSLPPLSSLGPRLPPGLPPSEVPPPLDPFLVQRTRNSFSDRRGARERGRTSLGPIVLEPERPSSLPLLAARPPAR